MEENWRQRFQSQNEDEALAMAMQRSLEMSYQEEVCNQQDRHDQGKGFLEETEDEDLARALQLSLEKQQGHYRREDDNDHCDQLGSQREIETQSTGARVTRQLLRTARTESDVAQERASAIPLCLPNNFEWDPQTQKCRRKEGLERSSLYVIKEGIEQLKKIKGPVCVVSVAGITRQGKSFVLAEAFDQKGVFPLGHSFESETIGIWLWIVPDEYKDCNGRKFTVILLDSEGIEAAANDGFHDHQIFTLTVLLASVLIYNSQGVPTRHNVEALEFIVKLSQRIQTRSKHGEGGIESYNKTFPHFIWLVRDKTLALPGDCKDAKDYFLKKIFFENQGVSESILRLFSGFDAFMLPPPTDDSRVLHNITEDRSKINPAFLSGLSEFKDLLKTTLAPKSSIKDGEFVTGADLAALAEIYIEAINTPGAIPNVERAWDCVVKTKCSEAKKAALETYDALLKAQLSDRLPCKSDDIRLSHNDAFEECEGLFMGDLAGFSTETVEMHLEDLKVSMEKMLMSWYAENENLTRQLCKGILHKLKTQHLDPVLQLLKEEEGAKVSFDDITKAFERIKSDYEQKANGAGDVITAVFCEFYPELEKEKEQYMGRLKLLKDFDIERAKGMAAKAVQDHEREKLREQQARLQQENHNLKREMERLIQNLDQEMKRTKEQTKKETEAQLEQLNNMVEANLKKAKKEREAFIKENKVLKNRVDDMNRRERENMEMIKNMNAQAAQKEAETQQRLQKLKEDADADKDALVKKINDDHQKSMEAMQTKLDSVGKPTPVSEGQKAMTATQTKQGGVAKPGPVRRGDTTSPSTRIQRRTDNAVNVQRQIIETRRKQTAVEEPGAFQTICDFVSGAATVVGGVVSLAAPAVAPVVAPIAAGVGLVAAGARAVAGFFDCSIM